MTIIGIFTKQENGGYDGTIVTFTTSRNVVFVPLAKKGEKSPDYRITFGYSDIGAAWKRTGEQGEHLSVRIDDPSFPAPIDCRLVKNGSENNYRLIWERDRKRA